MRSFATEDGYTLDGLDPPGFERFPDDVRTMFYGWVLELGLRAKDRDLAKGLDKDGKPFRPIHEATKKHRVSAMTPSGKGDPNAPPLIPGWQKSRTRSLLTGKAFANRVEFWWKFDPRTHDSWARILEYQRDNYGRDAFGLSPVAQKRVRAQAWERWDKWRKGFYEEPRERKQVIPKIPTEIGAGKTAEQWEKFWRETAPATLPGRPVSPKVMSPISGPKYNRSLQHSWAPPAQQKPPPSLPPRAPLAPVMPRPSPVARKAVVLAAPKPSVIYPRIAAMPKPSPTAPKKEGIIARTVARLVEWVRRRVG